MNLPYYTDPQAPIDHPCTISTNVADRRRGVPEKVFGRATHIIHTLEFFPPEGYRTRIVQVHMDFVAKWSGQVSRYRTPRSDDLIPSDEWPFSGWGLVGLQNSPVQGSQVAYPAADNTLIYRQVEVPGRADLVLNEVFNGDLADGRTLYIKQACFKVCGGGEVQMETSGEITFRFVPREDT